jgi:AcrR family transcriptional regulator
MRADAARNARKVVAAATEVWAELGPDAPLEEIARRAGVGVATLFRRFPSKDELVRACLQQAIVDELEPTLERAADDPDPWSATVATLEATGAMVARHRSTVAAARDPEAVTRSLQEPLVQAIWPVLERAQSAGAVRADLEPSDLPVVISMLRSTMQTDGGGERWRRYLGLLLDGLRATT